MDRDPAASLSTQAWKIFLAIFGTFAVLVAFTGVSNWPAELSPTEGGTLGADFGLQSGAGILVRELRPGSPLAAAGVKPGDRIVFDHAGDRMRALRTGEKVGFTLLATDANRRIVVAAVPQGAVPPFQTAVIVTSWIGAAMMLGVGLLIGWRRADDAILRCLSASLLSQPLPMYVPVLPGGAFQSFLSTTTGDISFMAAYVFFAYFAFAYTGSRVLRNRWGVLAFRAYVAAFTAFIVASLLSRMHADAGQVQPLLVPIGNLLGLGSAAVSMAALWRGWRRAAGVRRQRLAWLCACMIGIYLVYFGGNLAFLLVPSIDPTAFNLLSGAIIVSSNAGLGYAVLRHRILDFGFVVNRALVYATTSFVLAAAFILLGQLTNRVIHLEARQHNQMLDIAIGLGLALAGRQVVKWIDPRVQRIFYRRWHEAAAKLARFRIDAIHGMEPEAILSGLVEAVEAFTGKRGAALYCEADGAMRLARTTIDGVPTELAASDALVAAASEANPAVDLERERIEMPVALALPMKVHGRVTGILLVGARPEGEFYRRDEIRALATAAQQVAVELELARLKQLEARLQSPAGAALAPAGQATA